MKDDRAQGGFRRNAKPVFHDVKSDIPRVFDVFWVRALAVVERVARAPGDAMPQSACSAGRRSRSATPSTR